MSDQPHALSPQSFDAVLFDLGGVLLPLAFERTLRGFRELFGEKLEPLYEGKRQASVFDRFERGELAPGPFRLEVAALFGAEPSQIPDYEARFDSAFNAMLLDFEPSCFDLLRKLGQCRPVYLLSNTNELHLARFHRDYAERHLQAQGPFEAFFKRAYFSNLLGARKPEARAFELVLKEQDLRPERTLFLDDNLDNILAARALGMLAYQHPQNTPVSVWLAELLGD